LPLVSKTCEKFEWEIHVCKLKSIFIGTQRVVDYKIPHGAWYSTRLE
jgi:hypothetical protein